MSGRVSAAVLSASVAAWLCLVPLEAQAYVGPAAGISLLGALLGLLSVIGIVLLGCLRWIMRRIPALRETAKSGTEMGAGTGEAEQGPEAAAPPQRMRVGIGLRLAWFVLGLLVACLFPSPRTALYGFAVRLQDVIERFGDPVLQFHTEPARYPASSSGVVTHEPALAAAGLNLEVSVDAPRARLLDMAGRELHRWTLGLDALSRAWAATGQPLADISGTHWRRVRPLRDGSLLVVFSRTDANPYGHGLVKLDWHSRVQWMAPAYYHHSVDVGPEGRVYTLYQELTKPPVAGVEWVEQPFLNEGIAVLSPDGAEIERINLIEAFRGSPFEGYLKLVQEHEFRDPLHLNTVTVVTSNEAARSSIVQAGQLLVSARNINTIAVIDPGTRKVVWADRGMWIYQHEPVPTRDARLLVFDNLGRADGNSRVVEWDTATRRVAWQWSGTGSMPLRSVMWGSVALLENGNRLVSESEGGRAIEVTADGRVAWEWRTARRYGAASERIGRLMEMIRLPDDYFAPRVFDAPEPGGGIR